jgi:hypothetical protein
MASAIAETPDEPATLSGYLHDEEAERFGRLIRPILAETNCGRLA